MSSYTYQPLAGDKDQIRLATLNCEEDGINIKLETSSLATTPTYLALSYAWGDVENMKTIHVYGEIMLVRLNLWNVLHALKSSAKSILKTEGGQNDPDRRKSRLEDELSAIRIWIDALCIDQSNNPERTH